MEQIKVSVLVYVRNDVAHIEKCIRSILRQTLQEIELLIIDGASTDGTKEMAEKISLEDSRIRVISSEPGVGLQFNTGLREARGEYIGICESDDYLLPDMYIKQYETAKQYGLDIVKADFNRFCEAGDKEICFPVSIAGNRALYDCVIRPQEDMRIMKAGSQGFWSGLYRRDFLLEHNITMNETQGAAYQDMGFSFLSTIKANRVMLMKQPFYCYRMDNPNSSENSPQRITMVMEEYNLLKQRMIKESLFEAHKEWYFSWKIGGMLWFYNRLSKERQEEYAELMYREIDNELNDNEYTGSELSLPCMEIVRRAKESLNSLQNYLRRRNEDLSLMERMLENIKADKTVLIFGSGNMGKLLRCYLEYNNKALTAYTDNNKDLWGKTDDGIPVMDPKSAVSMYPDAIYMIANITAYEEIKRQLLSYHIRKENIIICNNYEKILVCLQKSVMADN